MRTVMFPSVVESHNSELRSVSHDLLRGLKIYENGSGYIIGHLAMTEGVAPQRLINSSPLDLDYRLLLKSGLLLAATMGASPVTLTLGFPQSTFHVNRQHVAEFIGNAQKVNYDTCTYGGGDREMMNIEIAAVDVVPEIIGHIMGVRLGEMRQRGNFFMISLGYGTFEACLSNEEGVVQRTMVSAPGIRYAVELAMQELSEAYYLGMRTEHQFDLAFQDGTITLNRQRVDIRETRKRALKRYYQNVISPLIRNKWTDNDFAKTNKLMFAGGGAMYEDLVDCFRKEFADILDMQVVDNPVTLASQGYCLRSKHLSNGDGSTAVGLDIGNANTAVSVIGANLLEAAAN